VPVGADDRAKSGLVHADAEIAFNTHDISSEEVVLHTVTECLQRGRRRCKGRHLYRGDTKYDLARGIIGCVDPAFTVGGGENAADRVRVDPFNASATLDLVTPLHGDAGRGLGEALAAIDLGADVVGERSEFLADLFVAPALFDEIAHFLEGPIA